MSDALEPFIKSIDERLGKMEEFLMEDFPRYQKETEHRMTVVETRIYIICAVMLAVFQGPSLVRAVMGAL